MENVEQILICLLIIAGIVVLVYLALICAKVLKLLDPVKQTVEHADAAITKADDVLGDVKTAVNNAKESAEKAKRTVNSVTRIIDTNIVPISAATKLLSLGAGISSVIKPTAKIFKAKKGNRRK